jgi:hypothetical protein
MAHLISSGAMVVCSGSLTGAPVPFFVPPASGVLAGQAAATVFDRTPGLNFASFGMCKMSGAPKPCVPAPGPAFLTGAPTVLIGNAPAVDSASVLPCAAGGIISFSFPGQFSVQTS